MAFDYKSWLKTAEDRLAVLKQQRRAIDDEISKLEQGIKGFAPLAEEPSMWSGPTVGVTEAVRDVFRSFPTSTFAPTGLRDEMLNRGFVLDQKNPMATIHQILSRLIAKREIEEIHYQGKTLYRCKRQRRAKASQLSPTAATIVEALTKGEK